MSAIFRHIQQKKQAQKLYDIAPIDCLMAINQRYFHFLAVFSLQLTFIFLISIFFRFCKILNDRHTNASILVGIGKNYNEHPAHVEMYALLKIVLICFRVIG